MSDIKRVFVVSKIVCLCVLFLFQLKKRREFFFFFGKIVLQTHNIVFKPTETLAKNTKKTKTPNARKKMLRPPVESRF